MSDSSSIALPAAVDDGDRAVRATQMRRGMRQRWDEALYRGMRSHHAPVDRHPVSQGSRAQPIATGSDGRRLPLTDELAVSSVARDAAATVPVAGATAAAGPRPHVATAAPPRLEAALVVGTRAPAPAEIALPVAEPLAPAVAPRPLARSLPQGQLPGPVHVAVALQGETAHVRVRDYALKDTSKQQGLLRSLRSWLARAGLSLGSLLLNGKQVLGRSADGGPVNDGRDSLSLDRRL